MAKALTKSQIAAEIATKSNITKKAAVGSENLIRPQILNLQQLAAEPLRPVFPPLALSNAA